MVLDTSALLAILFDEPERRAFTQTIEVAEVRLLSAANFVEAQIIAEHSQLIEKHQNQGGHPR